MASMFSSPAVPKAQPLPGPVKDTDKLAQEAAAEAARKRRGAAGYRSTILATNMMDRGAPALKDTLGS